MNLRRDPRPFANLKPAFDARGRHQPVSFWHETADMRAGPPLAEELACDVAIVGGGFTGLSTAYFLKRHRPELDVVLVEQDAVGHGASGRNGGFAMPLLGWDLLYCADKLGDGAARAAYGWAYDAVDHVKRVVAEHAIGCDLEATGYLLLNTCAAREKRHRREYETAHRLGFAHEWLMGAALHEHIRSDAFRSGVFDPRPCILNPAKLARGLLRVVREMGVRVFERTPLEALEDGRPAVLRAPGGAIRATQVLLALNGYLPSVGFMARRILPVHTYIVLTEPLTDARLAETGWSNKRTSLESARNLIHYFRLTADNRVLFGGEDVEIFYGGRLQDAHDRIFADLKARFREYFPSLRDVCFTHAWGGVLGVTFDMFPTFGQGGAHGNIFHAGGYSGHGVAPGNYAGSVLAPRLLRAAGIREVPESPAPFFWNRKPLWLGPDPLRHLGMRAYRHALRLQDRWQGA